MSDPMVLQAATMVWQFIDKEYPMMMDDDIEANLEALSTITQDESEDSIVRRVAMLRQDQFFRWLSGKQEATAEAAAEEGGSTATEAEEAQGQGPSPVGGTVTSEAMTTSPREVRGLTTAAQQGAA